MIIELIGLCILTIGIVSMINFLSNRNKFFINEAIRFFFKRNETTKNWNSHGRVYTEGIALIENRLNGKKKFIKQSELCDIGILS